MAEEEKELELDAMEVESGLQEDVTEGDEKSSKSREDQKVELDLDDAPFLEEEEQKTEPEEKKREPEQEIEEEVKEEIEESPKKKKIIILGLIGLVILVCLGVLIFFFLGGEKKQEKKEVPPPKKVEVKEKPPPPKPEAIQLTLRPFWVDYRVHNGHRYLHLTLVLEYDAQRLNWELKRKRIIIRDAIYYYLKNKEFSFFLDKKNLSVLKKEIITIIDQYLVHGRIKKIYFQNYLIE